jgi:hypothetical protein
MLSGFFFLHDDRMLSPVVVIIGPGEQMITRKGNAYADRQRSSTGFVNLCL